MFKELLSSALGLAPAVGLPACLPSCPHLFRESVPDRGMTKSKDSAVGDLKAWTPTVSRLASEGGGRGSWGQRPGPAHRRP